MLPERGSAFGSVYSNDEFGSASTSPLLDTSSQNAVGAETPFTPISSLSLWWRERVAAHQARLATFSALDWLAAVLPCVRWMRTYKASYIVGDVGAGLSIAFMVIPQGMSYAMLAGLPTASGLYGAFMPTLAYALFGSSPHLAVGPVAITSILLGIGLQDVFPEARLIHNPNDPGSEHLERVQALYNTAAIQVAFLASIMYVAVGALQLGFLSNFLSHSVISGFTTGAAVVIGISQLKYCLGLHVMRTSSVIETVLELARVICMTRPVEAAMCATWLAILLTVKRIAKRGPRYAWLRPLGPVSVCLLGIAAVKLFDLEGRQLVHTVGKIQPGLPQMTAGAWLPLFDLPAQLRLAGIIMLVDFMESISVAKTLARKNKYRINVTQEIVGMGVANFFGSLFNAYTTTGSFCRSAVLSDAGAKTPAAGAVTGLTVMLVLKYMTPLFQLVPYNAMGAIVLSSVMGLLEVSHAAFLYRASFPDFLVWSAAFGGTILLGVETGLVIAILLAIVLVIQQSAFPHVALLGRLPGTGVYRSVEQYPQALLTPHVTVVRVDAPIYFANVQFVRDRIDDLQQEGSFEPLGPLQYLVLDMGPVSFIDATAMRALADLVTELQERQARLVLSNVSERVRLQLGQVGLLHAVGLEWVFVSTAEAVEACGALVDARFVDDTRASPSGGAGRSRSIPHDAIFLSAYDRSRSAPPAGAPGAVTSPPASAGSLGRGGPLAPSPHASDGASPSCRRILMYGDLPEDLEGLEEVCVLLSPTRQAHLDSRSPF